MIVIYDDEGASTQSVFAFKKHFEQTEAVCCLTGAELQHTDWLSKASLLVMPGGRSLPYYKKLGSLGNANIRTFVLQGGSYLGVCAGAYYAARRTLFACHLPHELCLEGALCFFEGDAIGPVFNEKIFAYQSECGASVVDVCIENTIYPAYFNGGCYFSHENMNNEDIVAYYAQNQLPAILSFKAGLGRVVLSGVHPELGADTIPLDDHPHHQALREKLIKNKTTQRELLVKLIAECYS